jgi:hypothetical protein
MNYNNLRNTLWVAAVVVWLIVALVYGPVLLERLL